MPFTTTNSAFWAGVRDGAPFMAVAGPFALLFGVGYGITIPAQTSLRANYFGRKAYATITGYITFFIAITNVAYPTFAAWIYDTTGSYIQAFWIVAALQGLAIVFMYFGRKPDPPISAIETPQVI